MDRLNLYFFGQREFWAAVLALINNFQYTEFISQSHWLELEVF